MRRPLLGMALWLGSCEKVPIYDVNAGFVVADASWFAEEETLFVFWEVTAEQGIGDNSVIEVTWTTDDARVPWTDVAALPAVHTHVPVDCGPTSLCGSTSLAVPIQPRDVRVRLRYHRDGELFLEPDTRFSVVGPGPAWSHRSLVVYGVFDESNTLVQWRSRNQLPTLRNAEASRLGLRRDVTITDQRTGPADLGTEANPYGYGVRCPDSFDDAGVAELFFQERAAFNDEPLPISASADPGVCALSTVTDARDGLTTGAIARKNPEVRAAFPLLHSPIHEATPLKFFLAPCRETISEEHEAMQRQRLQMEDTPTTCIDDWRSPEFVNGLAERFIEAVEDARPDGDDVVLVIGLHREESAVAGKVEQALAQVVPAERHRSSPRLAGAWVLDSNVRQVAEELQQSTLWCPAAPSSLGGSLTCVALPDTPDLELGPFTFDTIPILTGRDQYLEFIDTYSVRQAGSVQSYTLHTPEFSSIADHTDLGPFGVATFLNGERFGAQADDAFSYCAQEEAVFFLFRTPFMVSEEFAGQAALICAQDPESPLCTAASLGLLPVQLLPLWHNALGETDYQLGLAWDFPFLLKMEYEAFAAGAVSAFQLSVPFGIGQDVEQYFGSFMWTTDTFTVDDMLTQCDRFCEHPTFGSAGVYRVQERFRATYESRCYLPNYPRPGSTGFPRDP